MPQTLSARPSAFQTFGEGVLSASVIPVYARLDTRWMGIESLGALNCLMSRSR
jgi:hypothetical protein